MTEVLCFIYDWVFWKSIFVPEETLLDGKFYVNAMTGYPDFQVRNLSAGLGGPMVVSFTNKLEHEWIFNCKNPISKTLLMR